MTRAMAKKAVHTPGPWDYFVGNANGRGLIRIEAGNDSGKAGHHIASMPRGAESESNADLICKAVNSHEFMLAFAKRVMADHRAQLPSETRDLYGGGCGCPQCEQARIALAKAEGRS